MISENRLHHILGVARRCREIAEEKGYNADGQRQAFLLGWLHDVGYEFGENEDHAKTGAAMLVENGDDLAKVSIGNGGGNDYPYAREVYYHGVPAERRIVAVYDFGCESFVDNGSRFRSGMLDILNQADLETMPDGTRCTARERVDDVKARYGEESSQYAEMKALAEELSLL